MALDALEAASVGTASDSAGKTDTVLLLATGVAAVTLAAALSSEGELSVARDAELGVFGGIKLFMVLPIAGSLVMLTEVGKAA